MDNNVIVERIDNLQKQNSKEHEDLIKHVKETNGKVAENTKWRWMLVGGIIVGNTLMIPICNTVFYRIGDNLFGGMS
jgi:hypothetical protein